MMLHLLKSAVNPNLSLKLCVENWWEISRDLREKPRRRRLQMENLEDNFEGVLS